MLYVPFTTGGKKAGAGAAQTASARPFASKPAVKANAAVGKAGFATVLARNGCATRGRAYKVRVLVGGERGTKRPRVTRVAVTVAGHTRVDGRGPFTVKLSTKKLRRGRTVTKRDSNEASCSPAVAGPRHFNANRERDIGVLNGQRGTVTALEPDTLSLRVDVDGQGERVLPASYIEDGHLALGYAMTVHKSQGMTADLTYALGSEDQYRKLGYTALRASSVAGGIRALGHGGRRARGLPPPLRAAPRTRPPRRPGRTASVGANRRDGGTTCSRGPAGRRPAGSRSRARPRLAAATPIL